MCAQQRYQLKQIVHSKVRASGRKRVKRIGRDYAGPSRGNTPPLALIVQEIDAILSPGTSSFDELELFAAQWVEWVSHLEKVPLIDRIMCS